MQLQYQEVVARIRTQKLFHPVRCVMGKHVWYTQADVCFPPPKQHQEIRNREVVRTAGRWVYLTFFLQSSSLLQIPPRATNFPLKISTGTQPGVIWSRKVEGSKKKVKPTYTWHQEESIRERKAIPGAGRWKGSLKGWVNTHPCISFGPPFAGNTIKHLFYIHWYLLLASLK